MTFAPICFEICPERVGEPGPADFENMDILYAYKYYTAQDNCLQDPRAGSRLNLRCRLSQAACTAVTCELLQAQSYLSLAVAACT